MKKKSDMKENSKNLFAEIEEMFSQEPSVNQKAWGMINEFYHLILTYMEKQNISRADLAKKLGKSRSAISQMFNKNTNITVKKMVEIADSIGLEICIVPSDMKKSWNKSTKEVYKTVYIAIGSYRKKEIMDMKTIPMVPNQEFTSISHHKNFSSYERIEKLNS